jgi:hypothetical protein
MLVAIAVVVAVVAAVVGVLVLRHGSTAIDSSRRATIPPPTASTDPSPVRHAGRTALPAPWASLRATRGATPVAARHVFPVAGCRTEYVAAHHDYPAADMFAPRGCLFVSPVAGTVDEVNRVDRWDPSTNAGADRGGLSVSVVGVDGVRYYGSHLEAVLPRVRPGMRVVPGTPLGRIGDTGSARGVGTHLHFAISWPTPPGRWWIRRGAVPPAAFLDAWRAGRNLSPAHAVRAAERAYGDDSRCHSYC